LEGARTSDLVMLSPVAWTFEIGPLRADTAQRRTWRPPVEELEAGRSYGGMTAAGSCHPGGGKTVVRSHRHGEERGAVAQVERKEEQRPGQRGGRDN
jgi:hypothetical protein